MHNWTLLFYLERFVFLVAWFRPLTMNLIIDIVDICFLFVQSTLNFFLFLGFLFESYAEYSI